MDRSATTTSQGTVSLEDARRVIAAAEDCAREIGQPQNIAVVDAGGNLVSHIRMDGAWIGSVDIAINKAFTARAFDLPTADLAADSQPGGQTSRGAPMVAIRVNRRTVPRRVRRSRVTTGWVAAGVLVGEVGLDLIDQGGQGVVGVVRGFCV